MITLVLREPRHSANQPRPTPVCKLKAKVVDELWTKYEPGSKPVPVPEVVVSVTGGVRIRRST